MPTPGGIRAARPAPIAFFSLSALFLTPYV
jgi:hypothetical protein